jgi:translation initiation factor 6 (eIF-6)
VIIRARVYGSDFVGLFLLSAGKHILYSKYMPSTKFAKDSDCWKEAEADSHMLGMFFKANSHGIVGSLPLKKATVLSPRHNALGNLILCNNKGALISPLISKYKEKIEEALKVKAVVGKIAGMDLVGALAVANNKGAAVHSEATEEELKIISKALKVNAEYGQICKSGFLGSLSVATDDVLVISPSAIGPEIAVVSEILEID